MTRYRVAATTRIAGNRRLIYRQPDGFTWRRGKHGRAWMSGSEADAAKRWAHRRLAKNVKAYPAGRHPFLELVKGAHWPTDKRLLRALNRTGQRRGRTIRIISGLRTPHEAWVLRMRFLSGRGNLAARCCSRYSGKHSWDQCGRDPWSNHADGNAADCGTVSGLTGAYTSLASDSQARSLANKFGIVFPVIDPWEPWHAEMRPR